MSKIGVAINLDVLKIAKERLHAGKKGTYLDATVFIDLDELDQYGNSGMVTQDVSKEEREQKVQGNILGNVKVFWSDSGNAPQKKEESKPVAGGPGAENDFDDDIPFSQPNFLLA